MANFRSSSPGVKFVGFTSALPSVQDWSISPKIFPDHGCLFYDLWHTHLAFQWITILVFEHIQNYFQRKIWAFALWPIFTGGNSVQQHKPGILSFLTRILTVPPACLKHMGLSLLSTEYQPFRLSTAFNWPSSVSIKRMVKGTSIWERHRDVLANFSLELELHFLSLYQIKPQTSQLFA